MSYSITIVSPAEREVIIRKATQSPMKFEDFHYLRNTLISLPVIRISIDLPIYRMENFRTFTNQKEHITKEKLSQSFFAMGQESERAQQVQHGILSSLARKGKDGSVTPVVDVLRKDKQREFLLVTSNGTVVNGNRRLAAMRELYRENTTETESFSHVNVMVLPPDVTLNEIVDIEASLQGKPETKLDYDWIGDAKLISCEVDIHRSISNVAKRLNRNEKDIKNAIQALAEADLYLKEWVKAEGEYNRVKDDAEQFFKDLPKRLEGKNMQLENASRAIAWALFDNRERLPSRIYDFNAAFGKLASDVLDRLSNNLGIATEQGEDGSDDGEFMIAIGNDEDVINYDAVIESLKDPNNDDAISALIDACQDSIETEKGQKSGDAALKAVSQAHSKMISIDLSRAHPKTFPGIIKQLDAIAMITKRLKEFLDNINK
jgi:hypothetical protein